MDSMRTSPARRPTKARRAADDVRRPPPGPQRVEASLRRGEQLEMLTRWVLRRSVAGVASLAAVLSLGGCALFFPSDPLSPPVAIRMIGPDLEMLIPDCEDQDIISAAVYALS